MPDRDTAAGVTKDALLDGRVTLFQPTAGYRAAIDPVLLAAAVPAEGWASGLDVGAGTGAAMLCALARVPTGRITGIELRPDHAELADKSLSVSGLGERGLVVVGDIAARPAPVPGNSYDLVLTNPPFMATGTAARDAGRAAAHMETVGLSPWVDFCLRCLRQDGFLAMIHRADRIADIIALLSGRAGGVEIIPLWPKAGVQAKRVIVRARKATRAGSTIHPGLVLHTADGRFTDAADAVLRHGVSLDDAMTKG